MQELNKNYIEITPAKAVEMASFIFDMTSENIKNNKSRRAPMFWGSPGISKSASINQLAKSKNYYFIDVRLSTLSQEDVRGIPTIIKDDRGTSVRWIVPEFLPARDQNSKKTYIQKSIFDIDTETYGDELIPGTNLKRSHYYDGILILFDELANAEPSMQTAAYQLVLDGKLGEYELPENAFVMAASNREDDGANVYPMVKPLANRFIHLYLVPSLSEFLEWGFAEGNINNSVLGYLQKNRSKFNTFNPDGTELAFATNRSWESVSDTLNLAQKNNTPDYIINPIISGTIGFSLEKDFTSFVRIIDQMPDPADIIDGKEVTFDRSNVGVSFALSSALTRELNERWKEYSLIENPDQKNKDKFNFYCDNFIDFLTNKIDNELVITAFKTAITKFKIGFDIINLQHWSAFSKKYGKSILKARQIKTS